MGAGKGRDSSSSAPPRAINCTYVDQVGQEPKDAALSGLLREIRSCRYCENSLPLGPNPVVRASCSARLVIIGQAPGTRVHATGIPWNDPSGDRLRQWLQLEPDTFYDESRIAIVPMGFCYPDKGLSGDLPLRPECALTSIPRSLVVHRRQLPRWHGGVVRDDENDPVQFATIERKGITVHL